MKNNILFGQPQFPDWLSSIQKLENVHVIEFTCKKKLTDLVKDKEICLIVPTTLKQMKFIIHNGIKIDNVFIICPDTYDVIDTLDNKCKFIKFMSENNLGHLIPNVKVMKYNKQILKNDKVNYPVIFKYPVSCGGFGSQVCQNSYELEKVIRIGQRNDYIVQKYIQDQKEYSAHLFVQKGIIKYSIYYVMLHDQEFGIQHGKMKKYDRIIFDQEDSFVPIFKLLNYTGFACIDFKLKNNKVKIFEINPRLGGTLATNAKDFKEMLDYVINYCY